jgi:hypothetical protein
MGSDAHDKIFADSIDDEEAVDVTADRELKEWHRSAISNAHNRLSYSVFNIACSVGFIT